MELILSEVIPTVALEQEFKSTINVSIERVRLHLAFLNIDKATNPGTLTLTIKDSTGLTVASKAQTFAQIKTAGGANFGTALDSITQQWHGMVSFIFASPVNLRQGIYKLYLDSTYTYTADTIWVGWVRQHDNMTYQTYANESFPTDLNQEEVPHTFEIYSWKKLVD